MDIETSRHACVSLQCGGQWSQVVSIVHYVMDLFKLKWSKFVGEYHHILMQQNPKNIQHYLLRYPSIFNKRHHVNNCLLSFLKSSNNQIVEAFLASIVIGLRCLNQFQCCAIPNKNFLVSFFLFYAF
jgi:hypothetical protein